MTDLKLGHFETFSSTNLEAHNFVRESRLYGGLDEHRH
jgi:CTP synthase (UTP-ammonia lyase)